MRHDRKIFQRFDCLVNRLKDSMDPYGSLIKLGKATHVEKRRLDVYEKGMASLKEKSFYYKGIISGRIKYSPEMRTEYTYKDRAKSALVACHARSCWIKEKYNRLIGVEIPKRYRKDLNRLFWWKDRKQKTKSDFISGCCDTFVSSMHVFESVENSIVSDCEMLGFCICEDTDVPPHMHGCMGKGRDILMLDENEKERMWEEAVKVTAGFLGDIVKNRR